MGGAALVALWSSAAVAQQTQEEVTVEEVVVTALKRSTTVQDTPMSITAMGGETIEQLGATQLGDYFRQTPSVNLSQGQLGQSRVSIRGVQGSGEATTGLYYDETPLTGPSGTTQDPANNAADLNLFDVQRVEVLRGPQGTLYGGGSMGGTLRVIFNKPDTDEFEGSVEAQLATTDGGSESGFLKGMVNVPIIDGVLAVRVAAYEEQRPGYIDSARFGREDINDSTSSGYRVLVGFTPTEDISVTATVIHQLTEADDVQGWYERVGEFETDSRAVLPISTELDLYNLTAEWETPFATVTASSSHYRYDILRTVDFSASYAAASPALIPLLPIIGYQPAKLNSWNNELRLSSAEEGPLQWTVGAYVELREDHIDSNTLRGDPATGEIYVPYRFIQGRYVETRVKQVSQFGEVTWKPIDSVSLTAGARHYDYTKTTSSAGTHPNLLTGAPPTPFSSQTADASGWVFKVNASYEPTPDLLFYVTAAEGFRPGGANNVPGLNPALVVYEPDSLWNYEAGVKSTWLGGRLTANLSIYQIDWKERQTSALTADGLYSFITNAGDARIRGLELEVTAKPITGLTLNGAIGLTDAELIEDQANADILVDGSTGLKGDKIPLVPDMTASASATYIWPIGDSFNGMVRADVAYTGEMASTFRPTYVYYDRFGDFATVNLRAGIEGDDWGAYVFVQNATNAVGIMNKNSGIGYNDLLYGLTPRTAGVTLRKRF